MSPGATMERVYLDLKARILSGAYPPGTRLEAVQLSRSLAASATPVRDALYRLSGERIIESWHQEGFRQPFLSEADLVDLYGWAGALLSMALKGRLPRPDLPGGLIELASYDSYPESIEHLFRTIAIGSPNGELRAAIVNVVERSMTIRGIEARVDESAADALAAMSEDYRFGRWSALRSKITRFHRRRATFAGRVAAEIRKRSEPLR
ncbi:GntR family transcriptional regulator [Sphingopyxis sp. DHUNG17]|uniref:GntR family transcriptional regulator n=1 Tax=Sphingopyxis jiangsuensis TaxID=2871171 RepID=UPI00191F16CC|nr:GntR family transcriptional regulator [Sphingopyxis lutea]MBL0770016.1 GntR family transcriptional regulator [Sphingopyxis lutea]